MITTLITRTRIPRPHPLTRRIRITKQRPARHIHPLRTTPRSRIYGGDFGLPPFSNLSFGLIPIRSIQEQRSHPDEASGHITQIPLRPRPPVYMLHDQSVPTQTIKNRGGMTDATNEKRRKHR